MHNEIFAVPNFCLSVPWCGPKWPLNPQAIPWNPPADFINSPIIDVLGTPRVGVPNDELKTEIIECWRRYLHGMPDQLHILETSLGAGTISWKTKFYDRLSINRAEFRVASAESGTGKRTVKSVFSLQFLNGDGETKVIYGVLRKVMVMRPFSRLESKLNNIFLRSAWYKAESVVDDMYCVVSMETGAYASEVCPVTDVHPRNLLRVQLQPGKLDRQYV